MKQIDPKLSAAAVGIAAILAAGGILASSLTMLPSNAFAQTQVLAIETIPLEGITLGAGEFLLLADTTPLKIESGHVAMNVPCQGGDTPTSDIAILAGVAPNLTEVDPEYVAELSNPGVGKCMFHIDIPQDGTSTTDVAIVNNGTQAITFESGNFAAISITSVGTAIAEIGEEIIVDEEQTGNSTQDLTVQEEGAATTEEERSEDEDEDETGDEDVDDTEDTDEENDREETGG